MTGKASTTKYSVENGELVMRFPIVPRLSKTEKSMLLATTNGAEKFEYDGMEIAMNINCYVPIQQWKDNLGKSKKSK